MLSFQSSCQQTLASLTSIATNDTAAAIAAAQDFRKVCPPQAPGVSDGGYSESELNEIQELMDGQCNEILEVSSDWQATIQSLKEQQEQSLKSHGEFVSKVSQSIVLLKCDISSLYNSMIDLVSKTSTLTCRKFDTIQYNSIP